MSTTEKLVDESPSVFQTFLKLLDAHPQFCPRVDLGLFGKILGLGETCFGKTAVLLHKGQLALFTVCNRQVIVLLGLF